MEPATARERVTDRRLAGDHCRGGSELRRRAIPTRADRIRGIRGGFGGARQCGYGEAAETGGGLGNFWGPRARAGRVRVVALSTLQASNPTQVLFFFSFSQMHNSLSFLFGRQICYVLFSPNKDILSFQATFLYCSKFSLLITRHIHPCACIIDARHTIV